MNNTELNVTMSFDSVQTNVGNSAFLNSDYFKFSERTQLDYFQVAQTSSSMQMFNYDVLSPVLLDQHPIYLTYEF